MHPYRCLESLREPATKDQVVGSFIILPEKVAQWILGDVLVV
jgi:hypothetical protein